ncbi:hypothetical protein PROFUN_11175 [Planoprotostelium fungivorum]|uniref:Uncharacterized protein n=1 Tax=Planoprotostelium fungivorum TaxID=1890364 RepID=A0A2P6NAQ9_9EUKA|nr:hypothetical protein PROFUN_11175 [Planoprotostelium fungivorum]
MGLISHDERNTAGCDHFSLGCSVTQTTGSIYHFSQKGLIDSGINLILTTPRFEAPNWHRQMAMRIVQRWWCITEEYPSSDKGLNRIFPEPLGSYVTNPTRRGNQCLIQSAMVPKVAE